MCFLSSPWGWCRALGVQSCGSENEHSFGGGWKWLTGAMRISFNKNKSAISHWPTEALILMQRHCTEWCLCQGVRERHHQSSGCASIAYWLIQELLFWRDYISGAQLMSSDWYILFFKLRRRISSRILNHFLTPEQGLWSCWWAVCTRTCCLRSSTTFPHCCFFSQVLVLCTMETNLPAFIPGTAFSSDKAQEEEHLSLATDFSSVFLLSCNFTVITAVIVWICCHCLAVRQF